MRSKPVKRFSRAIIFGVGAEREPRLDTAKLFPKTCAFLVRRYYVPGLLCALTVQYTEEAGIGHRRHSTFAGSRRPFSRLRADARRGAARPSRRARSITAVIAVEILRPPHVSDREGFLSPWPCPLSGQMLSGPYSGAAASVRRSRRPNCPLARRWPRWAVGSGGCEDQQARGLRTPGGSCVCSGPEEVWELGANCRFFIYYYYFFQLLSK